MSDIYLLQRVEAPEVAAPGPGAGEGPHLVRPLDPLVGDPLVTPHHRAAHVVVPRHE